MYTVSDLYDLNHTLAKDYLAGFQFPWEALKGIKDLVLSIEEILSNEDFEEVSQLIWVRRASWAPIQRFAIVPLSEDLLWWGRTV